MATTKKRKTAKAPSMPDWIKMARRENYKIQVIVTDNYGQTVESMPLSWNRLMKLSLNFKPIERAVLMLMGKSEKKQQVA